MRPTHAMGIQAEGPPGLGLVCCSCLSLIWKPRGNSGGHAVPCSLAVSTQRQFILMAPKQNQFLCLALNTQYTADRETFGVKCFQCRKCLLEMSVKGLSHIIPYWRSWL